MTRKVFIGKESSHLGKTAFQILANLKNFGIGRMLTRHEFDVFPEPSYHIVKRVQTHMDEELKYGIIWCETVIRGKKLPGIRPLKITYRPDFRLIPKNEEKKFLNCYTITDLGDQKNILPKFYQIPPLMKEWINRRVTNPEEHRENKSQKKIDLIPFVYQTSKESKRPDADLFWIANKVADEGETPTVEFDGKYCFNDDYLKHCTNF
ncbi:hypothetical protein SSS_02901 [Sarcoptes scabiei]|uniref:Uncharacterized protein n=1 Tax=Sarcoptes scabiei TaxID=52283 RepID=A0A131ZWR9_SARSC|nr:hypothetical protein SSS_02901 [Sarcoptes scabiei]KPM03282.1 hypothetical protein QR98_0017120 [Sarcoptes scabiei]UXI23362.1 hypothetical protein NH340_JMT09305 [Sarcoptes scabiei]